MSAEEQLRPDEHLIQYLLGTLPENEAEPLDALSIADDAFALRLSALENDLVDSYVRGELSGQNLNQFESFYLSSPARREKLAFAKSLSQLEISRATSLASAVRIPQSSSVLPNTSPAKSFSLASIFSVPNLTIQWGLAAVSLLLLIVSGFFTLQNRNLRKQLAAQSLSPGSSQDERNLQAQLDEQSIAIAKAQAELSRMSASLDAPATNTAAILLLPQTRGISQLPQIALASSATTLPLQLALESSEFPRYRVALKDPGSDKTLWTSEPLSISSAARSKTISVLVPSQLLKERNYLLQLTGVPANGSPVSLSTYMFHVVIR